jgi:hypothetical protein
VGPFLSPSLVVSNLSRVVKTCLLVRRRMLYGCSMVFYVWALQIAPRRGRPSLQAVACIGSLAEAIGPKMEEHVRGVIDSMFLAGLSPTLVTALEKISSK